MNRALRLDGEGLEGLLPGDRATRVRRPQLERYFRICLLVASKSRH